MQYFDFIPKALMDEILSHYIQNDQAHRFDHVIPVAEQALNIITANNELDVFYKPILMGVLLHDSQCYLGRENHHINAAKLARELSRGPHGDILTPAEWQLVELAVLEHRSSWKFQRTCLVSQAVAAADCSFDTVDGMLERAVKYRTSGSSCWAPKEVEVLIKSAVAHLCDKYGPEGYAWENISPYLSNEHRKDLKGLQAYFTPNNQVWLFNKALDNFCAWTGSEIQQMYVRVSN